ncbi:MAG TPA: ERCC4 domain-containing protein [Thermoguttaceae bacterium]|nr:ERCC4 domain-containing protein [Thermoguttaceae bacterium]
MAESLTFDFSGVHFPRKRQSRDSGGHDGRLPGLAVVPFTIVVDSREQLPYEFSGMTGSNGEPLLIVPLATKGLPNGDYSIEGMEDQIAIERKTLSDLYGSVTWGRARFEREIVRLAELPGFAAVVIEATWAEIMAPAEHWPEWVNQTDPRSIEGTIVAWSIRYSRVHWWACGSRRGAERRTFSILRKFWDEQKKR